MGSTKTITKNVLIFQNIFYIHLPMAKCHLNISEHTAEELMVVYETI